MLVYNQDHQEQIKALLLGRRVVKVSDTQLSLDDGTELDLHGNQGCGGCDSGWYELTELNEVDNIITNVQFLDQPDEGLYKIFVFAENTPLKIALATFEGSDGNGWYGTGYTIRIKSPAV